VRSDSKFFILASSLSSLFLVGCLSGNGSGGSALQSLQDGEAYSKFDVNQFAINKLVCDPMGGEVGTQDLVEGLHAKLWHLTADQPHYNKVQDYFDYGHPSNQDIFFSEVNVPTRIFSEGFPTLVGDTIKTDDGQNLVEYFAMEFDGGLRLGPDDPEGEYELALLSDDGALMLLAPADGDTYEVVVNNDGDHPTRMACGQKVTFTNDSQFKVKFKYYQGPRYHISVIPLWRKVTAETTPDPQCGKQGNSMYFDYNNQSAPKQAYLDLLARGWKPLKKENYLIPRNIGFNPCVESPQAVISNFTVTPLTGGVKVTWTTDVPTTAQVRYFVTADSSAEQLTTSDNILRTQHEIFIYNLTGDTSYTFQGVSITDNYGKSFSEEVVQQVY
tara:strand:- start:1126 stop:2283 length:1158 start_codon:yes stop_codon:yes gene_type:complete